MDFYHHTSENNKGRHNLPERRSQAVPLTSIQASNATLWDALFLPSTPTSIVAAGEDGTLCLWDFNSNKTDPSTVYVLPLLLVLVWIMLFKLSRMCCLCNPAQGYQYRLNKRWVIQHLL